MSDIIDILLTYRTGFLNGVLVTLEMCALIWFIGLFGSILVLGLNSILVEFVDWLSMSKSPVYNFASRLIGKVLGSIMSILFVHFGKTIIPSIPILVLLYWVHYPLQSGLGSSLDPFYVAVFVLSIVNLSMTSYILRESLNNLPTKYTDAAKLCGLDKRKTFFRIKLPLIIRASSGPILLVQLSMLHNTIFASLINVKEILWQSKLINSEVHKPIEIFTLVALFFLVISLPTILVGNYLKGRFSGQNYVNIN